MDSKFGRGLARKFPRLEARKQVNIKNMLLFSSFQSRGFGAVQGQMLNPLRYKCPPFNKFVRMLYLFCTGYQVRGKDIQREDLVGGVIPNISSGVKKHTIDSFKTQRTVAEKAVDKQAVHITPGEAPGSYYSFKAAILKKIEAFEKFRARLFSRNGYELLLEVHPPADLLSNATKKHI